MPNNVLIVLERTGGAHNLNFGEYNLDLENHTLYIGIGDFGQGGGGVTPVGTIIINENGTYDVTLFANAQVQVMGQEPTGTLYITSNGIYNVVDKAMVDVNVPSVTPTEPATYEVDIFSGIDYSVDIVDVQIASEVFNGIDYSVDDVTVIT